MAEKIEMLLAAKVKAWMGIHLPVWGTWVQSLVGEDFTCHRAVKPCVPQH